MSLTSGPAALFEPQNNSNADAPHLADDGGEMGALIRASDWGKSPIGPSESWSRSLNVSAAAGPAHRARESRLLTRGSRLRSAQMISRAISRTLPCISRRGA